MMRLATIAIAVAAVLITAPGYAATFWDDGMEYADQPTMAAAWDGASCVGDTEVLVPTTAKAHAGSKSLQEKFTGSAPNYEGGASCYFGGRQFTPTTTLYSRWYMYMTDHAGTGNFLPGNPTTKIALQFPDTCTTCFSVWWVMINGTTNLAAVWQHSINGSVNYEAVSGNIPQQQWVCVETQITMDAPAGSGNGILRAWINGTQVLNRTDLNLLGTGGSGPLFANRLYTQNGLGTIYYDDFAVGNTRINCLDGGGGVDNPIGIKRMSPMINLRRG